MHPSDGSCPCNQLKCIAYAHSPYKSKFGIPRQSGIVDTVETHIVFAPQYSDMNAFRGIEAYTHLWLIWGFSEVRQSGWTPLVRPPRLGGNVRKGVFATRSPFRPNPLGLSVVKFLRLEKNVEGRAVLVVAGADLMDGTPVYDVKPYVPYADSRPGASSGFSDSTQGRLEVSIPDEMMQLLPEPLREPLIGILSEDPRPAYQHDSGRIYGFPFDTYEIRFKVQERLLSVVEIIKDVKK